jgi:hypothetical protein
MSHSPSASFYVYDQVVRDELPRRLYEKRLPFLLLAAITSVAFLYIQVSLGLYPSRTLSLAALLAEMIGYGLDIHFTQRLFRLKPMFDKAGYAFPAHEQGIFLPPFPTLKAELFSVNALINLVLWPITYILPCVALGSITLRTQAILVNHLFAKRVKKTLEKLQRSEGV